MRPPRFVNPLIAGYLVIQLLAPIRGFIEDKFDSWGRFTWNMYAETYRCETEYRVVDDAGLSHPLYFERYLTRGEKTGMAYHRDALPVFHKFLCDQLARAGTGGRIRGECVCEARGSESRALIADEGDLCKAPNYGVPPG